MSAARLTPDDIRSRKLADAIHVDYSRSSSAWLGNIEGVPRLSVAKGQDKGVAFTRWYVDEKRVRDLDDALSVVNGDMALGEAIRRQEDAQMQPSKKHSLNLQIAEIDRELAQRKTVYNRLISSGKLTEGKAEFQIDVLKGVRATLVWLQNNENFIKQRMSY